eukprot:5101487-Pleurochrysis_carterae.AAC.1
MRRTSDSTAWVPGRWSTEAGIARAAVLRAAQDAAARSDRNAGGSRRRAEELGRLGVKLVSGKYNAENGSSRTAYTVGHTDEGLLGDGE